MNDLDADLWLAKRLGEHGASVFAPGAWRREVALRRLDRIIATTDPSSPIYAQARKEWLRARGLHVGPSE